MAPGGESTLSTLPSEIIYDICDYLSSDDILSLQLVSAALASRIPPARLEEIRSRRTIFKHPYELKRLKRLASLPLEKRSRIKHVIIDLADPNVVPISSHEFDGLIAKYSEPDRLKLLKFYKNYRSKNSHEFGNKYTKPFRKIAGKIRRNGGVSSSGGVGTITETGPENNLEDDFSFTARSEIYSILSTNFPWGNGPYPSEFARPKDIERMDYGFFNTLVETFTLLPNLRTLDFKDRSRKELNKEYVSRVWKAFNPALAKFLKDNPEVEGLPWHDWFENSSYYHYGITLAHAYPDALFCAAYARCKISEICMNGKGWNRTVDSVPLRQFGRWSRPDGVNHRSYEGNDPPDIDAFEYTYENLSRLEMCVAMDWMVEYRHEEEAPALFMTIIRNVEVLVLTRILEVSTENAKPSFIIPQMAVLPRLRRLEISKAGITIKALTEFLITNKGSLKEVVCALTVRHVMTRQYMIEFLTKLRDALNLEVFTMDFMTNKEPTKDCYLSVDIRGDWKDDHNCTYRVGTRCEQGRFWSWYLEQHREPLPRSYWVKKRLWGDFIGGIEEIETLEPCLEHWNHRVKDRD
ncbi:hypothetical protein TWF281_001799 [Arthrobotrys megalospora]